MGVTTQYTQVSGERIRSNLINNPVINGLDNSNYNYYSPEINSQSVGITPVNYYNDDNESDTSLTGLVSEYLSDGLSTAFLQKYSRELTVVASSLSVIILLLIGACVWCLIGLVKRGFDDKENGNDNESGSSSNPSRKKRDEEFGSDDLDTSCDGSDGSAVVPKPKSKRSGDSGAGGKKLPIISKIFSKQNGNSAKIIAHHRNIITPDRQIPFIVPTIPLPAQPPSMCQKGEDSMTYHDNPPGEPQPSTSRGNMGKLQQQSLLMAQQFFPQLEHPEVDSCPLIAFTLFYELSSQILNVRLLEGRNFPDTVNHTVAVKIYPGRSAKQSTKEFKAKSPVYNAEFCYHVRKSSLNTKILKLRAVIPGNPKRIIGYINVALKDLPGFDITNEEDIKEDLKTTHLWRRVELPSEVGDGVKLQVSLKWSPEPGPGLLTLKVIEAAGLHENRECDYTSSYVKVTLQEQGRNIKTRKTQLVRWGSVPIYDDVFVLTIPKELLSQISFLLVVVARGRLGSKAVLGKISIGPVPYAVGSSTGGGGTSGAIRSSSSSSSSVPSASGPEFWEDMCHQPDSEIVRWLHLLP